jgi:hydrogenase maturation protease
MARGLSSLLPDIAVIEAPELLPEHAEAVADAEGVLFLDAASHGTPGEVRILRLTPRVARATLAHALLPEEVLGLARSLYGRAPPASLVTIAGRDFSFGEGLSQEAEAALPAALRAACEQALGFTSNRPALPHK